LQYRGHFLSGKHETSTEHTCDQNTPHRVLINARASNFGNSKFKLGADPDRTDPSFCVGPPPVYARTVSFEQHDAFHIPRTSLFTHQSINQSIDDTSIWAIVSVIKPQTKEQIQTSLAFSRFVFSAFANSMCKPKYKNTSLEPFGAQEQTNCSKTQTGL